MPDYTPSTTPEFVAALNANVTNKTNEVKNLQASIDGAKNTLKTLEARKAAIPTPGLYDALTSNLTVGDILNPAGAANAQLANASKIVALNDSIETLKSEIAKTQAVLDDTKQQKVSAEQAYQQQNDILTKQTAAASPGAGSNGDGGEQIVTGERTHPRGSDQRVRLYAPFGSEEDIYGKNVPSNILAPLYTTNGLMFPYTPTISIQGESTWESQGLIHTNFDILSYQRTPSATISINGKFTVQNQREGEYALAAIHFFRTVTKMHFGRREDEDDNRESRDAGGDGNFSPAAVTPDPHAALPDATTSGSNTSTMIAGLPPPVLMLEGYGNYMFNGLRVVVRSYAFNLDDSMDMIEIKSKAGGSIWLPPVFTLNITLGMQQSPHRTSTQFNLKKFRTGELLIKGQGGWF